VYPSLGSRISLSKIPLRLQILRMPPIDGSITEPVPISKVAGRYLLFNNDVVTYLRKKHNICGVLIGSLPQIPQQNLFLGLPVELLPEETKLLVVKGVAYIIDAVAWHKESLIALKGSLRRAYLDSLISEGRKAQVTAERNSQKRAGRGLARVALSKAAKEVSFPNSSNQGTVNDIDGTASSRGEGSEYMLFDRGRSTSPTMSAAISSSTSSYTVTPTSTCASLLPPQRSLQEPEPLVPSSYPLFAHLHAHNYFITPGLRFGCDYTVYPGDPLRFHSHFLAVGYDWEEEIPLLDIVGGGRLGTGVKKGFLIGAECPANPIGVDGAVRTFCIEWGGM